MFLFVKLLQLAFDVGENALSIPFINNSFISSDRF